MPIRQLGLIDSATKYIMIKLSMVTISFNQAAYLPQCIESVLSQSGVDIEYIVVDPGSTDGSREIIERYRDRIAHVVFEPDQGPADGLNKGFARATGDVYGFLNSDDVLRPGAIERLCREWRRKPSADVLCGYGAFIDEKGERLRAIVPSRMTPWLYAYGGVSFFQQGTFFKAECFEAAGGFNPRNFTCWDAELYVDMALKGAKFEVVDVDVADFRLHAGSITGSNRLERQYLDDRRRLFEKICGNSPSTMAAVIRPFGRLLKFLHDPTYPVRRLAAARRIRA